MAAAEQQKKESVPFLLKVKYSLYSALIFFLVANPQTYKVTQNIVGARLSDGVPSPYAFFLHTGIFFLAILSFMMLPA
jgi:hypothetical protein